MKTKLFFAALCAATVLAGSTRTLNAQVTLLSEGFEYAFPGPWNVGDANGNGTPAYWKDVPSAFGGAGVHSGGWKGYCAGVGYGGTDTSPNYQNDMAASMSRTINLAGYSGAQLSFWYKIPSIESCCDSVRVYLDTNYVAWSNATPTVDWTEARINLDAHVGSTHQISFYFISDSSVAYEGCYLDDIQVVAYTQPGNDWCDGGIALADNVPYTMETGGAVSGESAPTCQPNFGKGVWFTFTPVANTQVTVSTCGSSFDTVLQVYQGTCEFRAPVTDGCNDDDGPACAGRQASVVFNATAGTTYRILAGGYGGASGTLTIRATTSGPPANDNCSEAIALTEDVPFTMDTSLATSVEETSTCQDNVGKGVWFTYTAPVTAPALISTCGSGFDTILQVYTGDCEFRSPLVCNDDNGPVCAERQASVLIQATAGATYRILAAGYNGASGSLTILVTRRDTVPPAISCPPNRTVQCVANVPARPTTLIQFLEAGGTASDNMDPALSYSSSDGPLVGGACGGTITRTHTVTDDWNNSASCTQIFTISDTEPPQLSAPGAKQVECGIAWTFDRPSATDNCGNASVDILSTVTNAVCGGSFTATRTWRATDACGNTAQTSQTVTVTDTTPPTLTCAGNKTAIFGMSWTFDAPTASDACDPAGVTVQVISTVTNGTSPCTFVATRTWRASDRCGNTAECSQSVSVSDATPPQVTCPGNIFSTTDPGSCSRPNVTFVATVTDDCLGATVSCVPPSGATFPKGVTTVVCTGRDAAGNTSQCSFTVTIRDTEAPQVSCPADIAANADPGQCSKANVTFTAAATDNCPGVTVSCTPPSGSTFPTGVTTVLCVATDAAGNTNQCSFTITIRDTEAPQVNCPPDIVADADPGLCSKANVTFIATATDNCPGTTVSCTPPSGSIFPIGVTPVTCTATDASGNTTRGSFTVTVRDSEAPQANCPTDIVADTDPGQCSKTNVTFTATATDNCPGVTVSCIPPSGSTFPKGVTTVTCTATDGSSNTSRCSFTVTVLDPEPPQAICSTNIVAGTDPGPCSRSNVIFNATAVDNCPGATVSCNPPSGSTFPIGVTTVLCTAADASGNTNSCAFTVTIRDSEPPQIICPSDLTVECAFGTNGTVVTFTVTATDSCDALPTLSYQPPSGSFFTLGSQSVEGVALDSSGNSSRCTFTLTVVTGAPPVLIRNYTPPPWQADDVQWVRDVNPHNKIDDTIDASGGSEFDVVVNFKRCVEDGDTDRLNGGSPTNRVQLRSKYLTSVAVGGLSKAEIADIASWSNVAFIEQQFGFVTTLDVSLPSLCVTPGPCSPNTVAEVYPGINGSGVNIAIFDTGVDDTNHQAFTGAFVNGYDADSKAQTNPIPGQKSSTHGTHVASIALGRPWVNLGATYRGVAPGAGLIDVRNSQINWVNAVSALNAIYDNRDTWRVRVINMSFRADDGFNNPVASDGLDHFCQLVDLAESMNIVAVAAAANDGPNNSVLAAPAAASRALTVAGCQTMNTTARGDDSIMNMSSRGPRSSDADQDTLDELKPEVTAPGTHVEGVTRIQGALTNTTTGVLRMQGTSMAAPHVAGLAALIIQAHPGINAASVKDLIIRTADPMAPESVTGTGWNNRWGYGLVNGLEALHEALETNLQTDLTFPSHPCTPWYVSPDISVSPDPPVKGQSNAVTVRICNKGPSTAVGARIHAGVHVYSAATPTFYDIGTRVQNIPVNPSGFTTVTLPWIPPTSGHQCVKVEIGYGPDSDYSNNTAQRNMGVQASPFLFEVKNIVSEEPVLIHLQPTLATPDTNWAVVLQPMSVMLSATGCPVTASVELVPNALVPLGATQRVDVTAIAEMPGGPVLLGGVSVLASNSVPQLLANDSCSGAIVLTNGLPHVMSTAEATSAGDPVPACQSNFGKGVWFAYTPAASGLVTVSTCQSDFDTVLQVFTGDCGALNPVGGGCADDGGPACTGQQASLSFDGVAGTAYHILAGGYASASGTLHIVANSVAAPVRLTISRDGDRVMLSWPVADSCFRLYATPTLSPAVWTPVTEPVVVVNGSNTVSVLPSAAGRFYVLLCEGTSVPVQVSTSVAETHARKVWGDIPLVRGEPIPIADINGLPSSYVVPYLRRAGTFPSTATILETVAALKAQFGPFPADAPESLPEEFYVALEDALGPMGYIQTSSTRENYPVLLVQNCLHPYFLFQDSARARATNALGTSEVALAGYFMVSPVSEYFAFTSGHRWVYVHARTLEVITPEEFEALPTCGVPPELASDRDQAWAGVSETGGAGDQIKWITYYKLIPIVDWTYWCVPTAFTMVACYYDHYANGAKIPCYGRIVDYWYENGKGHNVPNFIDELIDPSLTPPSWRAGGGITNILNNPSWHGYAFKVEDFPGSAATDWAWPALVSEIDADRPAIWDTNPADGSTGHAMPAFGYRIAGGQRFVIVYNTWGTTADQQYAEYAYDQWIPSQGGGPARSTGVGHLIPGGATGFEDAILLSPRGGEVVSGPSQIQWQVAGVMTASTKLYDSIDAGKTWRYLGTAPTPGAGIYTQSWTPPSPTTKGRVRIQCFDAGNSLVAADGSVKNVYFMALPELEPLRVKPSYCDRRDGKLVVTIANRGPATAGTSATEVKYYTSSGPQVVQLPTPSIPGNSTVEVLFDMPGACWDPDCNFEIRVDVLNQVNEADENNNFGMGTCL